MRVSAARCHARPRTVSPRANGHVLRRREGAVPLAYTFGQVMWSMLVFFVWILFFWMLFTVLGDLFRRHDISGWAKAGWSVFVIALPFLGIFVYLIAEGKGM